MLSAEIPTKGWGSYEAALKAIGERRGWEDKSDSSFLLALGLVDSTDPLMLSDDGRRYFDARFVREDSVEANLILQKAVTGLAPVSAVAQVLDGVSGATRATVETVLRSQGFGDGLRDRHLGSLIALMQRAEIVDYSKSTGSVKVLIHPAQAHTVPSSVFISPRTPFGNRVWLRRVLAEGTGNLAWLDKHFTSAAFESLWEAIDGNRVSLVRILSLYLTDYHAGRRVKRDFGNLKAELSNRGVDLQWRVIDSSLIKDTHDRWIISDDGARNIPNVNAIMSGQHSELNLSSQRAELSSIFDGYWNTAQSIEFFWDSK
ncbi:hypothetical protein JVX93_09630 [Mycolicibacterium boenickei]|nr:hypothetical protein JVX93_09630 [Mycolicibacterium boenickei]